MIQSLIDLFEHILLFILFLPTLDSRAYDASRRPSKVLGNNHTFILTNPSTFRIERVTFAFLDLTGGSFRSIGGDHTPELQVIGAPFNARSLDGVYRKTLWDVNNKVHYEREVTDDRRGKKIHIYWSGSQWIFHYDLDPSQNFDNLLAYAKIEVKDPINANNFWYVRIGKGYEHIPGLKIGFPGTLKPTVKAKIKEFLGIPLQLLPLYISFLLDAVAVGICLPLYPFFIMEAHKASAFQLSIVISINYIAQVIGCLVMGRVSDRYGRKLNVLLCLAGSSMSYVLVSKATSLPGVALARVVSGSFGGLVPVIQASVADVSSSEERPKYLGRIMAIFGLGFVIGPSISALLPQLSTRQKICAASIFPLFGFFISLVCFKETKDYTLDKSLNGSRVFAKPVTFEQSLKSVSIPILLLVLNGFLLMYAFSVESIYAAFMQESFGYGEKVLSTLFAISGLIIGIIQVFFIKPIISKLGKHATLGIGNLLLAIGMLGLALIRCQSIHFTFFAVHIVGYSIADTALASLISRYSLPQSQGRDLSLNQAAQSCAKVISPLIAGFLYEKGKSFGALPVGALPFLVGALFPALAIAIPSVLYITNIAGKRAKMKIVQKNSDF